MWERQLLGKSRHGLATVGLLAAFRPGHLATSNSYAQPLDILAAAAALGHRVAGNCDLQALVISGSGT